MSKSKVNFRRLNEDEIFDELSRLFRKPAHDRHIYTVIAGYEKLNGLRDRLHRTTPAIDGGTVSFISLNTALIEQLKARNQLELATQLANERREERLKRLMAETWADLLSQQIQRHVGLILADWELFYAYLGVNEVSRVRQMAINGKHACLLLPGALHEERVWIFDQDSSARREFPTALIIPHWTFELI